MSWKLLGGVLDWIQFKNQTWYILFMCFHIFHVWYNVFFFLSERFQIYTLLNYEDLPFRGKTPFSTEIWHGFATKFNPQTRIFPKVNLKDDLIWSIKTSVKWLFFLKTSIFEPLIAILAVCVSL